MSQTPGEIPPQPALHYYGSAEQPKLRGGPKVMAIIAIVLGAIGLLGVCGLPQYFMDIGPPNPVMREIKNDRILFPLIIGSSILGIAVSGLLLAGGIKCLKLDPLGQKILVVVAVVQIVLGVVGMFVTFMWTLPKFQAMASQHPNDPALHFGIIGGYIGAGIGVISLLFYCLLLFIFTRPETKAQFQTTR